MNAMSYFHDYWTETLGFATALIAGAAWLYQRKQTYLAKEALALSRRSTDAAEGQLALAKELAYKASTAQAHADERADAAEIRANLAHEQMKAELAPMLVLIRRQNHWQVAEFCIKNEGRGSAHEITWRYSASNIMSDDPLDDLPPRLITEVPTNLLISKGEQLVTFDYDRLQKTGILIRYVSADGRWFVTHAQALNNGEFKHRHRETKTYDQRLVKINGFVPTSTATATNTL